MAIFAKRTRAFSCRVAFVALLTLGIFKMILNEPSSITTFMQPVAVTWNSFPIFTFWTQTYTGRIAHVGKERNCSNVYSQPHLMRITDNVGQLGNNIFRLIGLLATARKYCYQPVFSKATFYLLMETFNLTMFPEDPADKDETQWRDLHETSCCRYNDKVEHLNTTFNWTINGFLQSWRYTAGEEEYIRTTLHFRDDVIAQVNEFFHDLRKSHNIRNDAIFVGVHVRRGDFVGHTWGYLTAPPHFLTNSMQFYREKFKKHRVIFIVASNGMDWTKNYTKGEDVYYTEKSYSVDFAILASCNHSIVTSGTFSFLTAWFAGGFVVYFSQYPQPASWLDTLFNITDYYHPTWYPMQ